MDRGGNLCLSVISRWSGCLMFYRPIFWLISAVPAAGFAQISDAKLDEVERRAREMEQRLDAAESGDFVQEQEWSALKHGMTQQVLGEPDRREVVGGALFFWYYDPPMGAVRFSQATGLVEGWAAPPPVSGR